MQESIINTHIGQGLSTPYSGLAEDKNPTMYGSDIFTPGQNPTDTIGFNKFVDAGKNIRKKQVEQQKPVTEQKKKETNVIDSILNAINSARENGAFDKALENDYVVGGLVIGGVVIASYLGFLSGKSVKNYFNR